jgi:mycothiol synthase
MPTPPLAPSLTVDARLHRRTVTIDDLDAVAGLFAASDVAVLGRSDHPPAEVAADLRAEGARHEGWYDDSGALVAYGWVQRVAESSSVQVDPYLRPDADPAQGAALVAHLESQALGLAREAGHDHALLDAGAYRQDARTASWLRERGFAVATTFTRMRIDFATDPPLAQPDLPPGVSVRVSERSEADLRTAHRVLEESFTEHYGHVARDFGRWRTWFEEHGPEWSTLYLAALDGEPVGELIGNRQFEADEDCGYVRSIGVVRAGRGRGIATALLRRYFADCRAEGRAGVLLHVDVANVTGALGVYESVGMRSFLEIDAWAKRVGAPS